MVRTSMIRARLLSATFVLRPFCGRCGDLRRTELAGRPVAAKPAADRGRHRNGAVRQVLNSSSAIPDISFNDKTC